MVSRVRRLLPKGGFDPKMVRGWMTKGFWAVMDQGLFATSNFALNILLARWLTPQEYGAFGVAFAIYLFVGVVHTAVLIEPMLVFCQGRYKDRLSSYLGALVYGHVGFSALAIPVLLLGGLAFALRGQGSLSTALVALALTGPFILLLWLMRRACYARLEPHLAASGGAWYMVLMLAGAYVLYRFEWISTASALGVMGFSSLVVSLWLARRLSIELPSPRSGLLRESFKSHWSYGRWSVANKALSWVPTNIFYLLLPLWGGLGAGASFKALMNLLMPMLQANSALTVLLLPGFVRAREHSRFTSHVRLALFAYLVPPLLYWLALGAFHKEIVSLAYGGRYAEYSGLLWLLGLAPVLAAAKEVLSQAVRALERPDWLFLAYLLSTIVIGTLGVGITYLWGIKGAGIGLMASQAVTTVVVAVALVKLYRRSPDAATLAREAGEGG